MLTYTGYRTPGTLKEHDQYTRAVLAARSSGRSGPGAGRCSQPWQRVGGIGIEHEVMAPDHQL